MAHLVVAVPDGRLAVREQGHGPPVLLVHGGTGTAAHDWADVRAHLVRSRRVVTVDLRGHGASSNHGGPLKMRRLAADLVHVLTRLGIGHTDLVGFSLGANTVLELLCRRPELARRAVLVGGSATGNPERILAMSGPEQWPRSLRQLRHDVDPSSGYWRQLQGELLEDWAANTEVSPRLLERVECPVLVVSGEDDRMQRPEIARHLAASLPDGRLELLPRAGHAAHHDRPERFLELLDEFLPPPPFVDVPVRRAMAC